MSTGNENDKSGPLEMGPINRAEDDKLNMKGSAHAIAKMLREIEPPFTVGLRGDWGSGKSSLMKMVQDHLDPVLEDKSVASSNKSRRKRPFKFWRSRHAEPNAVQHEPDGIEVRANRIKVIEFNPWSDSQLMRDFGSSSRMIEQFIRQLSELKIIDEEPGKQLILKYRRQLLRTAGWAAGQIAISAASQKFAKIDYDASNQQNVENGKELDDTIFSDDLRKTLTEKLEEQTSYERIIFIIDDLDRLAPTEAINILDVVTSLLKMPRCVFLIAIDQDIIASGVMKKMGLDSSANEGGIPPAAQNYFDKVFNFSIRISNTLSTRSVDQLTKQTIAGTVLPPFAQKVIATCAFDNPRTVKRLMWLAHYRRLEYQKSIESSSSSMAQLCAALGAVEDAYPVFHSIIFPSDALTDEGDHWRRTYAALLHAHQVAEDQSQGKLFGFYSFEDQNVDDRTEYDRVIELLNLSEKDADIKKLGNDIILSALEMPARLPGQLDKGEQEFAFNTAKKRLLEFFIAILGGLVEELGSRVNDKRSGMEPDVYMSRRHSGWLATYIASALEVNRSKLGARYSNPQNISRYFAKNWAFSAVYVNHYTGYLKDYLGGFVVYVGAKALEVWVYSPTAADEFASSPDIFEGTSDAPESLAGRPPSNKLALERQGEGVIGDAGEYNGKTYIGQPTETEPGGACIFRYEFNQSLKDNSDFEELYESLSEMAIQVIHSWVQKIS